MNNLSIDKSKKLRGCLFLNRSYVRWQHALALDLKERYGVDEWCAYGYGKLASEINDIQKDIHYSQLLIDDFLAVEAKNEIVDQDFLNQKEKEYGHPYWWQEFTADRFISINWPRQFYPVFSPTLNHYEILQHFQLRIKKIEAMLDEVKPDFVMFADAGALGVNLLYYIAKKRGIKTVVLTFTRFAGLSGFTDNLFGTFNNVEKIFENIKNGSHRSFKREEAIEFIKKFREKPSKPDYISSGFWNKSKQNPIKQVVLFTKNFVRKCIDMFDTSFPNVYNYSPIDFVRHHLIFWWNSFWKTKFDQPNYEEKYVFLALNSEPEISLLMQAPSFVDQSWFIRRIAESLPLTYKLYVKDHPSMVGYRNPNFYKEVRKFPNVVILEPSVDSIPLIKSAKLVMTITGSVGFEAILLKKPVMIFGSVNYEVLSFIKKCITPDLFSNVVKDALENYKHNEEELIDFVSALLEDSFKNDLTQLISEQDMEKVKKNPDISLIADQLIKYLQSY